MSKPLISVLIPTYNQPELAARAIQSCLQQNFTNYEIIIGDDSTNDKIKNLVQGNFKDSRIKYIKNSESLGSSRNWNKLIDAASGNYIKFLHHDDFFIDPKALEKLILPLQNDASLSFSFCPHAGVGADGKVVHVHASNPAQVELLKTNPYALFEVGNGIGCPSTTLYKNFTNFHFDTELKWFVDMEFYARYLDAVGGLCFVEEILVGVSYFSEHQITQTCLNNAGVELPELLHIYKNLLLNNQASKLNRSWILDFLKKYEINSRSEAAAIKGASDEILNSLYSD